MSRKDYIPTNPEKFNTWVENLYATVIALLAGIIPAAQLAAFTAMRAQYLPLWNDYKNEGTRTRQQSVDYHTFVRTQFKPFLRAFVQGYVVNNLDIPIGTRVGLGLNPRAASQRQAKPVITVMPDMTVKPLGGGKISLAFSPSGNKRTGILPDADGITVSYRIISRNQTAQVVINDGPGEQEHIAAGQIDGPVESIFSTKARFTMQFSREAIGNYLEVYARWTNSSEPAKNGSYTTAITIVIS